MYDDLGAAQAAGHTSVQSLIDTEIFSNPRIICDLLDTQSLLIDEDCWGSTCVGSTRWP
jgi:hypothetical protein